MVYCSRAVATATLSLGDTGTCAIAGLVAVGWAVGLGVAVGTAVGIAVGLGVACGVVRITGVGTDEAIALNCAVLGITSRAVIEDTA